MSDFSDSLSAPYLALAQAEQDRLTEKQRTMLSEAGKRDWAQAAKWALLHLYDTKMQHDGIPRKTLGEYLPSVSPTAISKWFTVGQISADHLLALMSCGLFANDLRPTEKQIAAHAWREGITWVKRAVLQGKAQGRIPLQWNELIFLQFVHWQDELDTDQAIIKLPDDLRQLCPDCDADWLAGVMRAWGKSYRLYAMEMNRDQE